MGSINWAGVVAAALAAAAVWLAFNPTGRWQCWLGTAALMLVSTAMLGHALARIGPAVLAAKPRLYFMQSAGLALAFVIPALLIAGARRGVPPGESLRDGGVLLAAYLAMGAVFLLLA